jgi:hypothetical protein
MGDSAVYRRPHRSTGRKTASRVSAEVCPGGVERTAAQSIPGARAGRLGRPSGTAVLPAPTGVTAICCAPRSPRSPAPASALIRCPRSDGRIPRCRTASSRGEESAADHGPVQDSAVGEVLQPTAAVDGTALCNRRRTGLGRAFQFQHDVGGNIDAEPGGEYGSGPRTHVGLRPDGGLIWSSRASAPSAVLAGQSPVPGGIPAPRRATPRRPPGLQHGEHVPGPAAGTSGSEHKPARSSPALP